MENTLNLSITLNDEQLKQLIVGNINDLPKEKLQDVLLSAIKEILLSKYGQELFIVKDGYYNQTSKPSAFLQNLVKQADITEAIQPTITEAVNQFACDYKKILETCMMEVISGMFLDGLNKCQLTEMWTAYLDHNNRQF